MEKYPGVASPALELPTGEPIESPPLANTHLPEARLITASEGAGIPQQQPNADEAGAAGTSSGGILVSPSGWQHAIPTELLASDVLRQFQDTFKDLYKFSTVCFPLCWILLC
jgi:hypothetical protein